MENKFNFQRYFFLTLILLIVSIIFCLVSLDLSKQREESLNDYIETKNVEYSLLSDSFNVSKERISKLLILLSSCENDKSIEKFKKSKYESQLRNFEEDCEHEKNTLLLNNRIYNSTDNELGVLLSRFGQSKSLSDAERILLPYEGDKGISELNFGRDTGEKKTTERREKNKSP